MVRIMVRVRVRVRVRVKQLGSLGNAAVFASSGGGAGGSVWG